ncbi:MAG: hypothetical protein QM433_00815 [Euryarchaeota archaeon]|nr:hypothetical protein [Euryarchaeota archaeon]
MTRSEIAVNELNGAWADIATPTAIDTSAHHYIAAGANFKRLLILVHISAGSGTGGAVTLKAGTGHPAFRRGLGDLVRGDNVIANDEFCIGPIETARYLQSDGTIHLDITDTTEKDIAGTIEAYALP